MIPTRTILGCLNCGNIFHIHLSSRQRCPHCGIGLHQSQQLESKL